MTTVEHTIDPIIMKNFADINEDNTSNLYISKKIDEKDLIDICELCKSLKPPIRLNFREVIEFKLIHTFIEIIKKYYFLNFKEIYFCVNNVYMSYNFQHFPGNGLDNNALSNLFQTKFGSLLQHINIHDPEYGDKLSVTLYFFPYTDIIKTFKSTILKDKELKIDNNKFQHYHDINSDNIEIIAQLNEFNNHIDYYYDQIKDLLEKRESLYKKLKE